MTLEEAAKIVEEFVIRYTTAKNHFRTTDDPKDFTLKLRLVQPRPDGETIRLTFHRNGDLGLKDAEFDAIAEECVEALTGEYPDLADFQYEYYYTG